MMTSDDTQLLGKNTQVENPQNEQTAPVAEETSEKQSATWKKVAIGGTSGILLGAGALYAVNAMAGETQADAADPRYGFPSGCWQRRGDSGGRHDLCRGLPVGPRPGGPRWRL